ncbi:tRNA1(Val) (adenine(37)-N6)-methyltransferase [Deferrisoma palaeochoriense]
MAADRWAGPDETLDGALGGAVRLVQPRKGYRFSVDAVLLARFAAETPADRVLDLGCGCGVVGLCLLALGGAGELVGVDRNPAMVDRARRSAAASGLADRARFEQADLREPGRWRRPRYPLVVSNPPYRPLGRGRVSPDPEVAEACHEVSCTVDDVVAAAADALRSRGRFCCVYPAERVVGLLAACRTHGLEPEALWPVHPRPDAPAHRVLVRAVKGGREGLELRPPLVLHAPDRKYSQEAERLLGPP